MTQIAALETIVQVPKQFRYHLLESRSIDASIRASAAITECWLHLQKEFNCVANFTFSKKYLEDNLS
jgi:hypothetical protein